MNTNVNTTSTLNGTIAIMYTTKDIADAAHCPGNEIGNIIAGRGVQPLHVKVTAGNKHYYKWGQNAMDAAVAWRVEQDKRVAAKQAKRIAKMPKTEPAPVQLPLPLPQPEVTETFPTIERRKDDAQLIAIHEQLIALNNTMLALLACWTKE